MSNLCYFIYLLFGTWKRTYGVESTSEIRCQIMWSAVGGDSTIHADYDLPASIILFWIHSIIALKLATLTATIYRRQLQYLVHWKGYEEHERTWEPASNVKNAPLVVEHFYKENPSAPWKLRMTQSAFGSLFKPVPGNLTVCKPQFCSLESCSWGGSSVTDWFSFSYLICD